LVGPRLWMARFTVGRGGHADRCAGLELRWGGVGCG
jgi:hypothetical protein